MPIKEDPLLFSVSFFRRIEKSQSLTVASMEQDTM